MGIRAGEGLGVLLVLSLIGHKRMYLRNVSFLTGCRVSWANCGLVRCLRVHGFGV